MTSETIIKLKLFFTILINLPTILDPGSKIYIFLSDAIVEIYDFVKIYTFFY